MLALTCGEPAGIGADIALQAWTKCANGNGPPFVIIGDGQALSRRAELLGMDTPVRLVSSPCQAGDVFCDGVPVLHVCDFGPVEPGIARPQCASGVLAAIDHGVALALAGKVQALVTNPIQKETLYQVGFAHQGHTEYLASLARNAGHDALPVMMLSAGKLRTVPVTVHIPLKDVATTLSTSAIINQTRVAAADLTRRLGMAPVRIAVTGLNPHAGEGGTLGDEEKTIIMPAIEHLRAEHLDVTGPVSADSIFHEEARARFDLIVCMYHDQALIPVKTVGFHQGVNTTLGLPFIRTSPDHGTALDLAGTGRANASSLMAAMTLAAEMARYREQARG